MTIPIRGMAPLFQVFDMPASLRFYRDVLGFEVVAPKDQGDDIDWVLLRLGSVELMLNTAYEKPDRPSAPEPVRVASHADTTLYFSCPDVDAAFAYLRAKGLEINPPSVAPYGMNQLHLLDPDGYNLCFQWPASPETQAEWRSRYGLDC